MQIGERTATKAALVVGPRAIMGTGLERSGLEAVGLAPMRPVPEDARLGPRERKLKATAREFEAVLLNRMIATMRSSHLFKDPLEEGPGADIFKSLLDVELGREMARRGSMGLSDLLYQELVRGLGPDTDAPGGESR